ncbi:MAG: endo-1,4-beta-xylanase [Nocardioidaceae bacterium]
MGTKTDWSQLGQVKQYLRSFEEGVTFYEVTWCDVENTIGEMDWTKTDLVINRARQYGFTALVKIRVGQCSWITGKTPDYLRGKQQKTESAMPKDMERYADFVKKVVERYSMKGVNEYAVENEVNSASFWETTPEDYRMLIDVAAEAIREADTEALVVDSGISSVASGYGVVERLLHRGHTQKAIDTFNRYFSRRFGTRGQQLLHIGTEVELRAALDSPKGKRNLAFLEATNSLVRDQVVDVRQVHFYENWAALPDLLDYLHAVTPPTVPLEMWELGAFLGSSRLSGAQRTAEMVKVIVLALSEGVTKILWLPLNVDPDEDFDDGRLYGLLSPDGDTRLAARAFAALDAAARGGRSVNIADHGVVGLGFDEGDHSTAFVWSACVPLSLPLPAGSRVDELATTPGTSKRDRVLVGIDPVQLDLPITIEEFMETLS